MNQDQSGSRLPASSVPRAAHAYVAYETEPERAYVTAAFVAAGLRKGERVLYFTDGRTPENIVASLESIIGRIDRHLAVGSLVVSTAHQSYLSSGSFDPRSVKERWFTTIDQARRLGHSALRVVGDMSWAAREVPAAGSILEYECSLKDVFAGGRVTGLCEYDRRLFGTDLIETLHSLHSCEVGPAPLFDELGLTIIPSFSGDGAKVIGRLSNSNAHVLECGVAAVSRDVSAGLSFDLSELQVEDTEALYALIRVARQIPIGKKLTFVRPARAVVEAMECRRWNKISNVRIFCVDDAQDQPCA